MATAIKVDGDENKFPGAVIISDGDGVVVKGNRNDFSSAKIAAGVKDVDRTIAFLGLPVDTPPEYLAEVIEAFAKNGQVHENEKFALRDWLVKTGNEAVSWLQLLKSIATLVLP